MKVFERDSKVNFVDEFNVVVGYDMDQDCCEHAGWFVDQKIIPYSDGVDEGLHGYDLEPYRFAADDPSVEVESDDLDGGRELAFRLVAEGKPDLWLHIFNAHNGYYAHGFTFKRDDQVLEDDSL